MTGKFLEVRNLLLRRFCEKRNGQSRVSLRVGHAADLTLPRSVIQHRVAASLPGVGGFKLTSSLVCSRKERFDNLVGICVPNIIKIN